MKRILLGISFLLLCAYAQAQTDSSAYYQYYGVQKSQSKGTSGFASAFKGTLLKVNLAAAICGDIPFTLEKVFDGIFGLELGAGIMPGYYIPENNYMYQGGNPYLENGLKVGYSLYGMAKFYTDQYGPEDSFYGGLFRMRYYNVKDGTRVRYTDIAFIYGTQMMLSSRLYFEYSYGIGVRLRKQTDANGNVISTNNSGGNPGNIYDGIITPIALKLGYMF